MTSRYQEAQEIIERAKQARAEYIASKFRVGALPIAVAAVLALTLVQFAGGPSQGEANAVEVVPFV